MKLLPKEFRLCLLHVAGRQVRLEVVNPETLEVIDRAVLR